MLVFGISNGRHTGHKIKTGKAAIALSGGSSDNGTVFSLSLPAIQPQLAIGQSGTNLVLAWPTNFNGFNLEFTTNLFPPAVWTTVLPLPAVVNGQNVVSNSITGARKFYRLSQ